MEFKGGQHIYRATSVRLPSALPLTIEPLTAL